MKFKIYKGDALDLIEKIKSLNLHFSYKECHLIGIEFHVDSSNGDFACISIKPLFNEISIDGAPTD